MVKLGDHGLPIQLLGYSVTHNFSVSNAGKHVEMDTIGLLHGRGKSIGHVRGQTASHVPQRRILGSRPETHRSQLFGKTPIESNKK